MIIPNDVALQSFERDLSHRYVYYSDLLALIKSGDTERTYFAVDFEAFAAGAFVIYTAYENETVIAVEQYDSESVREAIDYAKTKGNPILLLADAVAAPLLKMHYTLCEKAGTGYDHKGIYGCINAVKESSSSAITVRHITPDDVDHIAALPVAEWGNLPIVIRFTKNTDSILLAERGGSLAGYLIYASSYEEYYDIVNVLVHASKREHGVGKALVSAFAKRAFADGRLPYYGEAKTAASAALAASMGFEQLFPEKAVYECIR